MSTEIRIPALGESVTEATIGKWYKAVGDQVAQDEPLAELETDKVAMEVNAPAAGVLDEILAQEGDTVEVGALIGTLREGGGKSESKPEAKPDAKPEAEAKAPAPAKAGADEHSDSGDAAMSPAVRKLVAEHDLDPAKISGTGKDGRLTKADVQKAIAAGNAGKQPASQAKAPDQAKSGDQAKAPAREAEAPREERVRMTRLRQRIAERLKEAQNTAAMLTTFNEADMSAVIAYRERYKDLFEKKHGIKLGFMSFFAKACVHALREVPSVNAAIDGDEIVYKNYYHLGIAVSAPNGLVVPVLRDADKKSFAECELEIADMGRRARDGKLELGELQGGTFTISNGGIFGSLMSTPILNPPQSGILGMHKIQDRPVAVNGELAIRPMMYLALSYDHRLIDGREAVTFLVRVKDMIEDPARLLIDL
ncbi:MAG: 2-oxoglutarate dehydrogenase complex dihydrolipoyllysine-residue succinyltransferase [Sphingomonadales bacterium]